MPIRVGEMVVKGLSDAGKLLTGAEVSLRDAPEPSGLLAPLRLVWA